MSKQTKNALVPKLRFTKPNGQPYPKWEESKLRKLANRITEKNKDDKVARVLTNSAVGGIMDQRDYFDKDIANKNNLDGYYIVDQGDYVYNPRVSTNAPVGPISKNKIGTGVMSPLYSVFRFKNSDNDFYEQFFNTSHWYQYLRVVSNSGARHDRMSISTSDFMDMPLPEPHPGEQQKIADCLASIEELIAAQTQKLDAIKSHKKGLMQQLFPAVGETVPILRFPEFQDESEWEMQSLGKVIKEYRKSSSYQDEFEVLTSSRGGLVKQRDYYDNTRITDRDNIGFNIIPPNYLTYRSRSDDRKFFFNENTLGITGIISTYYPVFRVVNGSNKFFIELLSQYSGKVGKYSVGTSQTVLSFNELKRIRLPLPKEKEQQKIADCLSSTDELIAALTQKIDALKDHKKGLMQQLFPSVDKVNG